MKYIIFALYSGSNLSEKVVSESRLLSIFNTNNLIIFLVIIFAIAIILLFVFLFIPKLNKNPKKYFQRYLKVRENLDRIDEEYAKKKLSFDDYVQNQFDYAKEYEHLIKYLSQFPEYKEELKSYKLNRPKINEKTNKHASNEDRKNVETINYFIKILSPVAAQYRKEEVYQAILDENYSRVVAEGIVYGLEKSGIQFNSVVNTSSRKGIDLVDELLENKKQSQNKQKEQEKTNVAEKQKYTMPNIMDKTKYLSKKAMQEQDIDKSTNIEKPKDSPKSEIPDDFFKSTTDSKDKIEPTIIALKDLIKKQSQKTNFDEPVTFSKFPENNQPSSESTKKGLLDSIKNIFKSKKNKHTVSEVNDIFDNINKKLE